MPVISILSSSFCHGEEISKKVTEELSYQYLADELFNIAAAQYKASKQNLINAIYGSSSIFGMTESDKNKYISYLISVFSEIISKDNIVYHGALGIILPKNISHILRICIVGDFNYRVTQAIKNEKISEKDAFSLVKNRDKQLFDWANFIKNLSPWDKSLYDIVIPIHENSQSEAIELIVSNAKKNILQPTEQSTKIMSDFCLASKVQAVFADKKHSVEVKADNGKVTIFLEKYSLRLEHYKHELSKIAESIEGVKSVEVNIGPKFKMPSTFPPLDFDVPKKVLLVDDEVEFVQTLSERLESRKMTPSIAYNGEQALSSIEKDEPEVMVLDLKMPGIGGIEVLEKVKAEHPNTEVIILTGHGSEKERQRAMELGAFAYLEKPVDINVLSDTMKKAYSKLSQKKAIDN